MIRNACTTHGCPAPKFASDSTGVEVVFDFAAVKTSVETSVETLAKTPVEILQRLETNPNMTLAELAIEINRTLRAVELASAKLIKDGKLKRVGPRKGGYWEVLK